MVVHIENSPAPGMDNSPFQVTKSLIMTNRLQPAQQVTKSLAMTMVHTALMSLSILIVIGRYHLIKSKL